MRSSRLTGRPQADISKSKGRPQRPRQRDALRGLALAAVSAFLLAVACGGSENGEQSVGGTAGISGGQGAASGDSSSGNEAGGRSGSSGAVNAGSGDGGVTTQGGSNDGGFGQAGATVGGSNSDSGASASGAGGEGEPPGCAPYTGACNDSNDCCSGACDVSSGTCAKNSTQCSFSGNACRENSECCTTNCVGNVCQAAACVADGEDCQDESSCCSGLCAAGGTCQDINGRTSTCRSSGNPCTGNTQCCSGLCNESGQCDIGSSFCTQIYDVCSADSDCCSGSCIRTGSAEYGYCGVQTVGPNRCTDGEAGMICNDCGTCCSRACAPGPRGIFICQPPSGCRPSGEICKNTQECCGGDTNTGLPGAQESTVTCEKAVGAEYGRCRSQQCTPQGDVCQLNGGACGSSTSLPSNCCPTNNQPSNSEWKRGACEFDALLIPRCNGLKNCRPSGGYCSSSADCCRDPNDPNSVSLPCVPDPTDGNRLKCNDPGGNDPCLQAGSGCTTNADCCQGALCVIRSGEIFGTCGSTPGTGGGGAGGSGGSPGTGGTGGATGGTGSSGAPSGCAVYGQNCSAPADCCHTDVGVTCFSGKCLVPPG